MDSIITALHVVLKVKVIDELKGNGSSWRELDLPQAGGEGLVVGDFDAARVLGEGLLALGLALVVAGVGHADWVVEKKSIIALISEVDSTVLTLALVHLIPGGILIFLLVLEAKKQQKVAKV